MDKQFAKLSNLVGDEFTVESVGEFVWKKWDADAGKMLTSLTYEDGFRKVYPVKTDKGIIDMGSGQLGNLLEPVFVNGKANIIGVTYSVKSNGKHGKDIRYYFNPKKPSESSYEAEEVFND